MRDGRRRTEGAAGEDDEDTLRANSGIITLEVVFEILTSRRRRFILYYLQDHEIATVEEVARQIVAWEENSAVDAGDSDHRDRVATQLVHTHLPKLADAAFIEYDPRSKTIRYSEPNPLLKQLLQLLEKLEHESNYND